MMSKWEKVMDMAANEPEEDDIDWITIQADFKLAETKYKSQDDVVAQNQASLAAAWTSYQQNSSLITSPQDGKVWEVLIAPGMSLNSSSETSGQKILTITKEQPPLASVIVNEIDIGKVKRGQKATLTSDTLAEKTFTGEVVSVDRTGSQSQGVVNYTVLIQLDTGNELLYPNMSVNAEIITESKEEALLIPSQAIKTQSGQKTVKVLANDKTEDRIVEIGLEDSSRTEILSGISEGETIIIGELTAGSTSSSNNSSLREIMPGAGGFSGPRPETQIKR